MMSQIFPAVIRVDSMSWIQGLQGELKLGAVKISIDIWATTWTV